MAKPFGVSGTVCPHFGGISICTAFHQLSPGGIAFLVDISKVRIPTSRSQEKQSILAEIEVLQCTALILHIRLKS